MDSCCDYRGQPEDLNFPGQYGDGGTISISLGPLGRTPIWKLLKIGRTDRCCSTLLRGVFKVSGVVLRV